MKELDNKSTVEDSFRKSLDDVVVILEKLNPYCTTLQEAIELLELARTNDGQLRLVLNLFDKPKTR